MPLFAPPLPMPQIVGPDATDLNYNAFGALTAGIAYFASVSLYSPLTLTSMRCNFTGAVTGNVDMGIFDATGTNGAPGNMLGHTGAIAAVTGLFTQNLTATLTLSPGRYWFAWLDTAADSVGRSTSGIGVNGFAATVRSTATNLTVLASSIATQVTANKVLIVALFPGGFS